MRFVSEKLKEYWRRTKNFCVHNILHADDPPHNLALGIAVGLFVALLPLIGIQMGLALGLAWLIRANKAVAVTLVWISNPLTMVPMYYPGYWMGCKLLSMPVGGRWAELLQSNESASVKLKVFMDNLQDFAAPLFLGTFLLATLVGVLSYYAALAIIRSYRLRRWGQLLPPSLTPKNTDSEELPDDEKASRSSHEPSASPQHSGSLKQFGSSESAA